MNNSKMKKSAKAPKRTVSTAQGTRNRQLVNFKEAAGKTIKSIEHKRDVEDGVWTLELCFTDDTFFFFDIDARPGVRAEYAKDNHGDLEPLRYYGRKTICDW